MQRLPSYMPTLLELYVMGAARRPVVVSSGSLGESLGLSQQAVSKHLVVLESEGLIVRKKSGRRVAVTVTPKGSDLVVSLYSRLRAAVEGSREITFHGKVTTGLGEGAYYVSLPGYRRQFRRILGFDPYPGTLNLVLRQDEVEMKRQLKFTPGLEIEGFRDEKRTYGPVKCFAAKIEGRHDAAVLLIERTHHSDSVLEMIAPQNLRRTLGLSDGTEVSVTVYPGDKDWVHGKCNINAVPQP
jgi:riboflavin kinase